jgi:hypothetical protein
MTHAGVPSLNSHVSSPESGLLGKHLFGIYKMTHAGVPSLNSHVSSPESGLFGKHLTIHTRHKYITDAVQPSVGKATIEVIISNAYDGTTLPSRTEDNAAHTNGEHPRWTTPCGKITKTR